LLLDSAAAQREFSIVKYIKAFLMEKTWNNKKIRLLQTADADTIEQFLADYCPVIYTWMYYQVGADAKIALDLTGRALSQAVKNLSGFAPDRQTLFLWLKDQAVQSRDEGLEHWQIKPQRPWAWSQLPDEVLCGLSRFRSDRLDEEILANLYVHEIIQAAMAELDPRDRELLTRRFCLLDSEEHIAEEMDCSIEDIQNRLYRSRHSFRREFFHLITSANSGFAESSDAGDIEIQDANLEKLLSTTTINLPLDDAQMDMVREQLLQAAEEVASSLPKESHRPVIFAAGIVLVIIALLTGTWRIMQKGRPVVPSPPVSQKDTSLPPSQKTTEQTQAKPTTQDDIDGEELKLVFALGQAGDLEALLEILKSGQYTSQVAAAHFIGKLADPSAIEFLEQAEDQWYPEQVNDNPFAKAIDEILARFPDAAPAVTVEEAKPEPKPEKKAKQPPAQIPNITGLVSNFANQPVSDASMELRENPIFSSSKAGRKIASVKTNPDGQFQFSEAYQGPASLTCRIPEENVKLTRALWCLKDSTCIVNVGGKPALTGTVVIDGEPLAGQTLYLSDTFDITHAAFGQEVVTDQQGGFSFLGVAPGVYTIMNMGLDNRIHRLATIEMPPREVFNVNMDIQTGSFSVEYPADPNTPMAKNAVLAYTMDAPKNYHQSQAALTENGILFFETVRPGSYVLKIQLDTGIWVQEQVEIDGDPTLHAITLDPVTQQTAFLTGRLLGVSPVDLFLTNANQRIHIDIEPDADGGYTLDSIPADIYSLAAFVKGQLIEFMQIDLQSEPELTLDLDPVEMMRDFSPLYVVVTDPTGVVLSGAQVWLTGNGSGEILTASSTGQGAFLAAPTGEYTLSVAHSDYPSENREIVLKSASVLDEPNSDNTILIQLGMQGTE